MNKLTKGLKIDSGKATTQGKEHGLHIRCKHRTKEEHHDTKWKYREKSRSDQSDKEEVHRSITADAIDFKERDSEKDPKELAIDKSRKGGDIYS
eukprot:5900389-Heterocapsa_arctica.AAC.1